VALGACVVDKVVIEGGLVDEDRRALWGVGREGAVLSTCMLGLGEADDQRYLPSGDQCLTRSGVA
jgi:hypothetical protein